MVFCAAFCLLSTGLIQPIATVQAKEAVKSSIDVQQVSETTTIISLGNLSITIEKLENGSRLSTVLENGTILTNEITTELRPLSNITHRSTSKESESVEKAVFINGDEINLPTGNPEIAQPFEFEDNPPNTRGNFWWDGVIFNETSNTIKYPHPDRACYNIAKWDFCSLEGTQLMHSQFSDLLASDLAPLGYEAIGVAIGESIVEEMAIRGLLAGLSSTEVGIILLIIGTAIAAILTVGFGYIIKDEEGCIWWWLNKDFPDWLLTNLWWLIFFFGYSSEAIIMGELYTNGYLRVGDWTPCNGLGISAPVPPHYALSVTKFESGGGAYVNNEGDVLGSADGYYATLYSGSHLNKAEVTATMSNTPVSGQLYVRCYTPSGNGANFKVYVCNQYGVWTSVVNTNLYPPNNPTTYNCGYVSNIVKVSIVAYHEYSGYPSTIYVDAICLLEI